MSQVNPGDVLAGKFRIERVLGQGGMGVVVAAHHLQLDERVALKFLLPEALQNGEAVARFAREARAAVKIKSEHVARVSDVGTLETGAPYMVMEYLQGSDLAGHVRERGPLPPAEAVDYVLQACEALAEAHALGIVHRDLKPANLFLTHRADGTPCVKVLDFGISKLTNQAASDPGFDMTRTQSVMGSPLYMSPEQMASSKQVDGRTDIWAIGAILYELLTARVPFEADTMPQLCAMILQEPPRSMREFRADIPDALQQVVLRCLEKDKNRRFQNVAELAQALAPFGSRLSARSPERIARVLSAAGIGISAAPALAVSAPTMPGSSTQGAWGQTGNTSRSKLPLVLTLLAVLLLGAGGVGAFVVMRNRSAVASAESASSPPVSVPATQTPTPAPAAPTASIEVTAAALGVPTASATASAAAAPEVSATATAPKPAAAPRPRPAVAKPAAKPASTAAPKPAATAVKKPAIDPLEGRR